MPVFSSALWGCSLWCWLVLALVFGRFAFLSVFAAARGLCVLLARLGRLAFGCFGVFGRLVCGCAVLGPVLPGAAFAFLVRVSCFRCRFLAFVGLPRVRFLFAFLALVFRLRSFCALGRRLAVEALAPSFSAGPFFSATKLNAPFAEKIDELRRTTAKIRFFQYPPKSAGGIEKTRLLRLRRDFF